MEFEAQVFAVELLCNLTHESSIAVEAADFILVLVGHELEKIACHGFRETLLAESLVVFGRFRLLEPATIARRIGRVLIVGEERGPTLHAFIWRLRHTLMRVYRVRRDDLIARLRICGSI